MSAADKLQELAKMFGAASRVRPQVASIVAEPSQTNAIATEKTTVDSVSVKLESAMATPAPEADLPMRNLDLDTAIRLRWALRDIKAKRTILTPVSPTDLTSLIEMRLVEMRDDALMLTNKGHQTLDHSDCPL
jgi:hypothetical protein